MAAEIDRLEIAVEAQASKANSELDKMTKKLEKVANSLDGINASGLQGLANGVQRLSTAMQGMNSIKSGDFSKLAKNIEKLGNINQSSINGTASALRQISSAMNSTSGISAGAEQITSLANSLSKLGNKTLSNATTNIPELANGLKTLVSTLNGMGEGLQGASSILHQITEISTAISALGKKSIQNAVTSIPQLAKALNELMITLSKAPQVSEKVIRMTNALANLAAQGGKVRSAASGVGKAMQSTNSTMNSHMKSMHGSMGIFDSFIGKLGKLTFAYFALKQAAQMAFAPVKSSMDFGETINLFQTSFKKIGMDAAQKSGLAWGSAAADQYAIGFIDKAQAFNDKISQALSLDPNTTMNYQAVFAQISHAMGLTSDVALNMSESFTLLGNDIASLWNLDTKTAMEKLQSGLAGQVKPLRELGIDITQASLQLTAYKYGVTDSISKMSQAAKTQLRWLTIMDQSEVAFGDMAKTINSPANQLRILEQQWNNLSRSIGNVFLPIVTAILPYINALVIALRKMINTLATAMGYELPDYTDTNIYKDVTGDIVDSNDDVTNSANSATKATNKLKKATQSFDQLHILNEPNSSNSGSGNASAGSGYSKLDDAINAKTASYMAKFNDELTKMGDGAEKMADKITGFFSDVAKAAEPTLSALKKLKDEGLAKLGNFTFGVLSDFYNDFLVPLGNWTLGKGLPRFIEITNNFLNDVDWKAIRDALDRFWKALEPFAENIGEGLLSFYKDLLKVGAKFINKTVPGGVNGLASALENINPENARSIGYALGIISVGIASIKISNGLIKKINNLSAALNKMPLNIKTNVGLTVALIAVGVAYNFIKDYFNATPAERKKMMEDMWSGDYRFTVMGDFKLPSKNDIDTSMDALIQPLKDKFKISIPIHIDPFRNLEELYKSAAKIGEDAADKANKFDSDKMWKDIQDWWGDRYLEVKTNLATTKTDIEKWWTGSVVPWWGDKYLGVKGKLSTLKSDVVSWWTDKVVPWWGERLLPIKNKFDTVKSDVIDWWDNKVIPWWGTKLLSIKNKFDTVSTDVQGWWTGKVIPWWGEKYLSVKNRFDTVKTDVNSWWTDKVIPWWGEKFLSVQSKFATVEATVKSWGQNISSWWDKNKPNLSALDLNIKLPHINLSWDIDSAAGKALQKLGLKGFPNFSVSYYANGGMPNMGQMFIAREKGPELVGQMGNHSNAVANNLQIESGIEEAAYRGYMRAMMESGNSSGSNSNQAIMVESNLYVDSEKMYSISQKGKAKSERRFQTALQPT